MKKRSLGIVVSPVVVLSLVLAGFLASYFKPTGDPVSDVAYLQPKSPNEINTKTERQPSKEDVAQKIQTLKMPFIANEGQVDDRVEFYANTLGGTVFVTTHGEIVYALPKRVDEDNGCRGGVAPPLYGAAISTQNCRGEWHSPYGIDDESDMVHHILNPASWITGCDVEPETGGMQSHTIHNMPMAFIGGQKPKTAAGIALREEIVGGKVNDVRGERESETNVNYFKGNDPSKWKTNIPTYEMVSLGEVYKGVELKLKAYGNNVEKLFYVKPGASPEQIKMSLSGGQPPESPFIKGDSAKLPSHLASNNKIDSREISSGKADEKIPLSKADQKIPLSKGGEGVVFSENEKGARGLWVNEQGELVTETALGPVKFTKPVAYQEIDGKRVEVECKYTIADRGMQNAKRKTDKKPVVSKAEPSETSSPIYGFTVAQYDKTKDLVIDPLLASTFLGGGATDEGYFLAINSEGDVFVTGRVNGATFPTTNMYGVSYDNSHNGNYDVFVSKLNGNLTSLLASTFLGGASDDVGQCIAINSTDDVYVTGYTKSSNFPAVNTYGTSHDTGYNDNGIYGDVFVSKLNGNLTSLLASTFLGGTYTEQGRCIAINSAGDIYVTGYTESSNFPTTNTYGTSYDTTNGYADAFVSKLNGNLTNLLASTFLGGNGGIRDEGYSLAINSDGDVYVTGGAYDPTFPTTNIYGTSHDTSHNGSYDGFVSKLNGNLTSLLASTFLGGNNIDYAYSLAINSENDIYVVGHVESSNFPTNNIYGTSYDTSYNGNYDSFLSKLNGNLTSLLASTFLGTTSTDEVFSLAINSEDDVYVTGSTYSSNFPTNNIYGTSYDTSHNGNNDGFVSKLNGNLTSLLASTFLGATSSDCGRCIATNSGGDVYVTGWTYSSNFPTSNMYGVSYDTSFNSSGSFADVFVSRFDSNLTNAKPTVTTENATDVTFNSATLNGTVNANGLSTTAWFEYGTNSGEPYSYTINYGSTLNGTSTTPVSINTGETLSCDTWYYFRIVAQNGSGTAYGSEMSFKTFVCPTPTPTPPPTVIDLVFFTAEAGDDGVVTLNWQTATEVDNAGFNILRSRLRDGEYKKINDALIPAQGDATSGASYRYEDTPQAKGTYYYKLEDVDTNGVSTMHGPEKVRVRR